MHGRAPILDKEDLILDLLFYLYVPFCPSVQWSRFRFARMYNSPVSVSARKRAGAVFDCLTRSGKTRILMKYLFGELAEWSKARDWKSCKRQKRFEGSNPSLSAIRTTRGSSGTLSPAIRYSRVCSRRGFLRARQAALSSVDKWVLRNRNL